MDGRPCAQVAVRVLYRVNAASNGVEVQSGRHPVQAMTVRIILIAVATGNGRRQCPEFAFQSLDGLNAVFLDPVSVRRVKI